MWKREFKTNEWLMLLASLPPFVYLVSFVHLGFGKGSTVTCWRLLVALYSGGGSGDDGSRLLFIFGGVLLWLAIYAVSSLIIGWVVQAIVVVLVSIFRRDTIPAAPD